MSGLRGDRDLGELPTGEVSFEVRQTAPLLVRVSTPWGDGEPKSTLSGRFNAFNLVARSP
ncbi:MAG: hypothetical protein CM15mP74_01360 [Halieaceae bacterium]|nr:MAG: hypothetical protein CM15mP74_01360 [Halieaceae bacterium]